MDPAPRPVSRNASSGQISKIITHRRNQRTICIPCVKGHHEWLSMIREKYSLSRSRTAKGIIQLYVKSDWSMSRWYRQIILITWWKHGLDLGDIGVTGFGFITKPVKHPSIHKPLPPKFLPNPKAGHWLLYGMRGQCIVRNWPWLRYTGSGYVDLIINPEVKQYHL
jgi:hypothetical protein